MNRLINYCSILLTPVLVVIGSTAVANVNYWDDKDGSGWVIHGHENATSPGGFSAVAEPAGPSGTKSTEQSPPPKHQARSTSTSLTPTEPHHKGL